MTRCLLLLLLTSGTAARSQSVSDEFGVGQGQLAGSPPATAGYLYNRLAAEAELSAAVALNFDAISSWEDGATPQHLFGLGVDWSVDGRLSLGAQASLSPDATQRFPTLVVLPTGETRDAQVQAHTQLWSLVFNAGYDTAADTTGASPSVAFEASAGVNHMEGTELLIGAGDITRCRPGQARCRRTGPGSSFLELNQYPLAAAVWETVGRAELGVDFTYFLYDQDPSTLGDTAAFRLGRASFLAGGGPWVVPLVFSVRPELRYRWGQLTVGAWLRLAGYVGDNGTSEALGTKLQWRFSRNFKAWVTASVQADGGGGPALSSFFVSSGLRASF